MLLMKTMKLMLAATALTLTSTAAADQVGFFLVGAQYQQDNGLRYGLGLPVVGLFQGGGVLGISGDVSYLLPLNGGSDSVSPYYGFGLGLGLAVATGGGSSATGVSLYPNALIGVNFNTASRFTPFVEGSVGPSIAFARASSSGSSASGAAVGIGFGLRLGVNYDLR